MQPTTCSVDGCDKQLKANNRTGRCTKHYYVPKGERGNGVAISKQRLGRPRTNGELNGRRRAKPAAGEFVSVDIHLIDAVFLRLPVDVKLAAIRHALEG